MADQTVVTNLGDLREAVVTSDRARDRKWAPMQRIEQVIGSVDRFQDSAEHGEGFSQALVGLSDSFEADCATLELLNRRDHTQMLFAEARLDPDSVTPYLEHYQAISPRVRYGLSPKAKPVAHDFDVLSADEMERDPFYAEFLPDFGLRYFLSIAVDPAPGMFGIVSFQFRPEHGHVDQSKQRLAGAVRPLLARSMRTHWRRQLARRPDQIEADMVDRLGLTPAEARLAFALLSGRSISEHADMAGISRNTAYTHYARLKDKLGCRRQSQVLVRLHRRYPLAGERVTRIGDDAGYRPD